MKRILIALICIASSLAAAHSQTRSAGGVVTDHKTKKPMEYISVYFKNTASGCVTNYRGEFYVQDKSGADTLVIDAIGYEKQFIKYLASKEAVEEKLLEFGELYKNSYCPQRQKGNRRLLPRSLERVGLISLKL